jgi:cytoskeletal protein CcmA (bactofilin family)
MAMSDTMTRDVSGAVQNVRRTASQSVTMLRAATGLSGRTTASQPAGDAAAMGPPPSIISAHTEMTGSLTTTDEMHVYGKIKGDVRAAAITVCAGAVVNGDLIADTIVVDGAVEGRIEAQHVLLRAGAVVKGEIMHGSLGIDTAAEFEGAIKRAAPAAAPVVAAE